MKQTYWMCVDCSSIINDDNMQLMEEWPPLRLDFPLYVEFCYGCMNYNPEVVIAYR